MRRGLGALAFWLGTAACGPGTEGPEIRFMAHALQCSIPELQAKLQITGGLECGLTVREDRSVEGTCPAIPTGAVREFRLVYFVLLPNDPTPLELATALTEQDLRNWESAELRLTFTADALDRGLDDDSDGASNLVEICAGSNPRAP